MRILMLIAGLCLPLVAPLTIYGQNIQKISKIKGTKSNSKIRLDSANTLHVVYDNNQRGKKSGVFYQQSSNNGLTYTKQVQVSSLTEDAFSPDVATDPNGNIFVVWSEITKQGRAIHISKSTDRGSSFSTSKTVSLPGQTAQAPNINIDSSSNIFISYFSFDAQQTGLFAVTSSDGASSFSAPKLVSGNDEFAIGTTILFDSQRNVYLFYGDAESGITYLVKSNNGQDFSTPQAIAESNNIFSNPQATIDNQDTIYVAFSSGNSIKITKSADLGKTFVSPIEIPDSIGGSFSAIVVDTTGKLFIAWQEGVKPRTIFSTSSQDGGLTFAPKSKLSTNSNFSFGVSGTGNTDAIFFSWISITAKANVVFATKVMR
ncbi:MAG: sialidase family protein [Acidobacteriota bacterium]